LPETFQTVVDHVLDPATPKSEPFYRTAVGRAYYAAHLASREFLLTKKKVGRNRRGQVSHIDVIDVLRAGPIPGVGDKLHQLGKLRESADYDLSATLQLHDVEVAKLLVTEILAKLPACA
jgi:uncharacterized protein (UPF0332 family)